MTRKKGAVAPGDAKGYLEDLVDRRMLMVKKGSAVHYIDTTDCPKCTDKVTCVACNQKIERLSAPAPNPRKVPPMPKSDFMRKERVLRIFARDLMVGDITAQGPVESLGSLNDKIMVSGRLTQTYDPLTVVEVRRKGTPPSGIYRLERPVDNPRPDLRRGDWFESAEFRADGVYLVTRISIDDSGLYAENYDGKPGTHVMRSGIRMPMSSALDQQRFDTLVEQLIPVDDPLQLLWLQLGWDAFNSPSAPTLLDFLVRSGHLTMQQAQAFVHAYAKRSRKTA